MISLEHGFEAGLQARGFGFGVLRALLGFFQAFARGLGRVEEFAGLIDDFVHRAAAAVGEFIELRRGQFAVAREAGVPGCAGVDFGLVIAANGVAFAGGGFLRGAFGREAAFQIGQFAVERALGFGQFVALL